MAKVTIISMRVFPSLVRGKEFDAVWDVGVDSGELSFMLQVAEAEDGPWSDLWDAPTTGTTAEGVGDKSLSLRENRYLRLGVFVDGVPTVVGQALSPGNLLKPTDFRHYRELLRRENLALQKKTGVEGWVVQKQTSGCPCPDCADEILVDSVMDSNCKTCLGTGKIGGYTCPRRVMIDWGGGPKHAGNQKHTDRGPDETEYRTARLYAFPALAFKDIVVDVGTGNRYSVIGVKPVEWKTHRTAQIATLVNLPKSDPAYQIRLT